ncbi:MAG: DegT/DnrJ/EryC1/StrS family aminotransferase [Candidatus Brocadiia bacterium]|nr:DegT/DnrJ/EryC1/StrS family aminotransferase [Candidatus Brocadiia bacterium]
MTTRSDDRLAIDGGTPVRQDPFPPWPVYGDEAKKAVIEVLDSGKTNYWAGPKGRQFQNEFAAYCGVKHAIAVNSGTSALQSQAPVKGVRMLSTQDVGGAR